MARINVAIAKTNMNCAILLALRGFQRNSGGILAPGCRISIPSAPVGLTNVSHRTTSGSSESNSAHDLF